MGKPDGVGRGSKKSGNSSARRETLSGHTKEQDPCVLLRECEVQDRERDYSIRDCKVCKLCGYQVYTKP